MKPVFATLVFLLANSSLSAATSDQSATRVGLEFNPGKVLSASELKKTIVGKIVTPIDRNGKDSFYGEIFYEDGKYKPLSDSPSAIAMYRILGDKIIVYPVGGDKIIRSISRDKNGKYYFISFMYGKKQFSYIRISKIQEQNR